MILNRAFQSVSGDVDLTLEVSDIGNDRLDLRVLHVGKRGHIAEVPVVRPDSTIDGHVERDICMVRRFVNDVDQGRTLFRAEAAGSVTGGAVRFECGLSGCELGGYLHLLDRGCEFRRSRLGRSVGASDEAGGKDHQRGEAHGLFIGKGKRRFCGPLGIGRRRNSDKDRCKGDHQRRGSQLDAGAAAQPELGAGFATSRL